MVLAVIGIVEAMLKRCGPPAWAVSYTNFKLDLMCFNDLGWPYDFG